MNHRTEKFSLPPESLKALEALVQALILFDAALAKEDGKDEDVEKRLVTFHRRRISKGSLLRRTVRSRSTASHLRGNASALVLAAQERLAPAPLLHRILVAIELRTVQPYADGDDKERKLSVSDTARDRVVDVLGGPDRLADLSKHSSEAIKTAARVYSKIWQRLGWGAGAAVVAVVVSVFAGPVIGGWVGSALFGLSGAAAVSAGLAFLGGGALAAGGFGMLGGTVVIAAGFGVAGAGASQLFLVKNGEEGAKLALIRHMAVFVTVEQLGLLDHILADDFITSVRLQREQYARWGAREDESSKQARAVVGVMVKAEEFLRDRYAEATRRGTVLRTPLAWSDAEPAGPDGLGDLDFAALAKAMLDRESKLLHCLNALRHADRLAAEVREQDWMKGVMAQLGRSNRKKLLGSGALVGVVIEAIVELVEGHQAELEHFARAVSKAEVLQEQVRQKDHLIARYQSIATQLHQELVRLRHERDDLRAALQRSETSLGTAMLAAGLYRAMSGSGPRALEVARDSSVTPGVTESPRDELAWLDLCIAVGLGADPDVALAAAAEAGRSLPSSESLQAVLASLELPLGSPIQPVRKLARQRLAEAHPDRHVHLSPPMQAVMRKQYDHIQLALQLHERYHEVGQ